MGSQVRQALREATTVAHLRLHRHPVLAPLAAAGLTRAAYGRALAALLGVHSAADRTLATVWPDRAVRTPLIIEDLERLGLDPAAGPAPLPEIDGRPAALGIRYVVDGSFFGGQALVANVWRRLKLGPDNGAGFFAGGTLNASAEWRRLLEWLEMLTAEADRARACAAAVATFGAIEGWLDGFAGEGER
jgi:heme oxygenase